MTIDHQHAYKISLPALQGGNTLGFLAALGVVQLCANFLGDRSAVLGWPHGPSGPAVIGTTLAETVEDLAEQLSAAADRLKAPNLLIEGVAFPAGVAGIAPKKKEAASLSDGPDAIGEKVSDPIRGYSFELGRVAAVNAEGQPEYQRWLSSVLALDEPITAEKRNGSLPVSPFAARGPGTVMLARTLSKLQTSAAQPTKLLEALTFWVREDSIAGYIDPRAKRNASYQASKKDHDNYGVSAAAWLAMMSIPFFPALSVNSDVAIAPGWTRPPRRQSVFRWPVWSHELSGSAIAVLLGHPTLLLADETRDNARLISLGVTGVFESERSVEGNNDGPMTQAVRLWPAPQSHPTTSNR
jgi:hypothetical protein